MQSQIGLYDSDLTKIISKNPGIHYSKLREITKLANGTLQRNLKHLEMEQQIKVTRELGRTRYFDKTFSDSFLICSGILQRPTLKKIIILILEDSDISFKEIVKKSKKSASTISLFITELVENGIITRKLEKNKTISFKLKNPSRMKRLLSDYNF